MSHLKQLQHLYSPTTVPKLLGSRHTLFWLVLSLAVTLYFGLGALFYAFSSEYVVQDDARHHVVWMQRFVDPQLFPNDLIADYFQSVAPNGFKLFYWLMAQVGIEPLVLAKVLPVILGLITSVYFFGVGLQIFPVPAGVFLATLLLNQMFWLRDDVSSASPRAFLYPLFAAFLYYLLKRSLFPCLVAIALMGLFYPQLMLVEIGILTVRLLNERGKLSRFSKARIDYILWAAGLAVALCVILPYALASSKYDPVVTVAQMKVMPEFSFKGRSEYLGVNPVRFWLDGDSGIRIPVYPPIVLIGFLLPFLLKTKLPLIKFVTKEIRILPQTVLASLGLFFLAHILLIKLHFPNRYTYHSFRFVMAMAAGISLTLLLEAGVRWLRQRWQAKKPLTIQQTLVLGFVTLFGAASLIVPAISGVFLDGQLWIDGKAPQLYEFFSKQPKDILIASLAGEANNLPAFSQRSLLVGREFALPFHTGYYSQIRQRTIDLLAAHYTLDVAELQSFIQKYGIDFFVLEPDAFQFGYVSGNKWMIQFEPIASEVINRLVRKETPALAKLSEQCSVLKVKKFNVVDAACITRV
jgi:hypothetical protein